MIYPTITAALTGAETVIKQEREENGTEGERKLILKDKLYLTRYHNYGAFWNIGERHPEFIKGVSMGLCVACTILYILTLGRKGKHLLKLGLSILLGGAYSNTYDRMVRGYVVDYLGLQVENEKLRNMVFNLSDLFIVIGAAICVIAGK